MSRLTNFVIDDATLAVAFVETQTVKEGVECDIYSFVDDMTKDLAIVRVGSGYETPLQRVVLGTKTIEGFVSGAGTLTIQGADGENVTYTFADGEDNQAITVAIGQIMQWHAHTEADLTFYELCEPPYVDGRFENLSQ